MNARTEIEMDAETQRRAEAKAAELGMTFAEYVGRLIAQDVAVSRDEGRAAHREQTADVSVIFDLITDGPESDVARDKDKMVGEAVWAEYLDDIASGPRPRKS